MSEKRYIEADAIYEMARTNPNYKDFGRSQADLTSLRELLDEYPAADVEPVVRGEWKWKPPYMVCSACNRHSINRHQSKYCQHCGAHMERSGSA